MLETSKDILYLVIAGCILWITVFICWMFYYLTKILRNASQIIEEFRIKLQTLAEGISHVRDRVEQISNLFTLGTSGLGGFMKKVASKQAKKIVDRSTTTLNKAAKEAVDKAVEATARQAEKAAKKIRKR